MSALDDMIATHLTEVRLAKKANWQLSGQTTEMVAQRLGCPVQTVKDVLYQVSIETGQKPVVILDALYEFFQILASYQDNEEER